MLARGERYGQLWLLKGLKPEYAQKKLYRDLLRKEFDIAPFSYIIQTLWAW